MPRPRTLNHDAIASAALAVIDRDGLAALSMRATAGELGMGTMSLYRYVADREQVEALVVDLVLGAVDHGFGPRTSWRTRVVQLLTRTRAAVGAHPAVVPLLLTNRHASPNAVRWGETLLTTLTDAGFTGRRRVIAFRCLVSYLVGALQTEHLGALAGPGTAALAALPEAEHPVLVSNARLATTMPADEEFRQGLAVVLRGLEA